jgi:glycine/D-amino acid oxidase-like deaminating enzyme
LKDAAPRTSLPPSLWAATAPPGPPTPPLKGALEADVAVVGAGYTGLSAALHLAERGASVAVLDAGEPGWGASGRNGGQVIPGLKYDPDEIEAKLGPERGAPLVEFAAKAPDLVFDLIRRYAIACDAMREGWLQPAHSPAGRIKAERRAEQWAKRGADVAVLDRAAMAAHLGSEAYCGGWIDRRGGAIQPLAYARGLAAVAVAKGIAVHGHTPAQTLTRGAGKWYIEAPGASVTAETVLLCTNGYTTGLFPGLEREVVPVNSYQAATRPLPEAMRKSILPGGQSASDTRRVLLYFRLDRDGRFIIGGRGAADDDPAPERFQRLHRAAREIYPALADAEWSNHWSGRIALTRDFLPHLVELGPGLFAGLGYQGRGVAMATAMGALLAARAQGSAEASLPLPMGPRRPFPLHWLRVPVVYLAARWYRLLDGLA